MPATSEDVLKRAGKASFIYGAITLEDNGKRKQMPGTCNLSNIRHEYSGTDREMLYEANGSTQLMQSDMGVQMQALRPYSGEMTCDEGGVAKEYTGSKITPMFDSETAKILNGPEKGSFKGDTKQEPPTNRVGKVPDHMAVIGKEAVPSYGATNALDGNGFETEPTKQVDEKNEASKVVDDFSFRASSRGNKLTLISLALVNFCASAAFALIAPFYPNEAAKKGLNYQQVGVIFGLYGFVIFLTAPFLGGTIKKIRPKPMFLSGIFLSGSCQVLFGTLNLLPNGAVFFAMCFVTRSLESLGSSAAFVASFALIAQAFPTRIATIYATMEIFSGFGFMIAPPLGGALFELGGYGLPFYTLGGLLILGGIICSFILPTPTDHGSSYQRSSTVSLFLKPSAFVITVSIAVVSGTFGFLDATLANYLATYGLSPFWIGWLFFLLPFVYAIIAPLWGWIGDTKGHTVSMIVIGNFLCALPFVLIGPVPFLNIPKQLWLTVISLVMAGLFIPSSLIPSIKALIEVARVSGFPESLETYGIVSGLFNSAFYLGEFIGPVVMGGVVVDTIGFSSAAGICALCFIIVGILITLQRAVSNHILRNRTSGR